MRIVLTLLVTALTCLYAKAATIDSGLPHLEKRGSATQLVVNGQPYLILGGEVANTASSDLAYMDSVWPRLAQMNLNTVLLGASWALIEPAEGKYDFAGTDALIEGARKQHLHIIVIWFGSWKNGLSSFAPGWVKRDTARFPRARVGSGTAVEILSTMNEASRNADATAFAAFARHLREVDGARHTVLMVQLENEVGILGDSRDRSDAANRAFEAPVPEALLSYLASHRDSLRPALKALWTNAGAKTAGSWVEVFGNGAATDELFMAWHYSTYMDTVATAGKAEYALPMFTNTWIVQPQDKTPGDYPSGGSEPHVLDVWRAGAPHIDINCPDIYLPDFTGWCDKFTSSENPLFVPESRGDAGGVANAFYAIGQKSAIGYSPFGIDDLGRLEILRPQPGRPEPRNIEGLPLPQGYAVLTVLEPLILDHQSSGTLAAASVNPEHPKTILTLGGYELTVDLRKDRRDPSKAAPLGYGMFFALGSDTFLAAGADIEVSFRPITPGPSIAGIAKAEAGTLVKGVWVPNRTLNGDDIVIRYDLSEAALEMQSGSGLRFLGDHPTLQRVELYRYQ